MNVKTKRVSSSFGRWDFSTSCIILDSLKLKGREKKSEPLSALFVLQNSNFTRKRVMMSLSVEFEKGGVRFGSLC